MKRYRRQISSLVLSLGIIFSFNSSVFAERPDVEFIDVSHHNNNFGIRLAFYQTLKAAGVKGVVVKVSEGTYFVDPAASVNIANAKQAGLIANAYHYARFTSHSSAKSEADWFDKKLKLVGFDKKKDGYVVVDVEETNLSKNAAHLTEYTNTFIKQMKKLGYNRVDLYTGSYFYNHYLKPNSLIIDNPWLASYPANPVRNQPTANFSNGKGAWQWASDYKFIGMSSYGYFDVSEDYAGKYTNKTAPTQKVTKKVGTIKSVSLVNYLKSKGMNSSYNSRTKLAKQYGITNYEGTAAQNIALLAKLKSGVKPAKVNLSNSKLTTVSKPKTTTYTVKYGDTLSDIAKKYHTTISKLKTLNHVKNVNFIRAGQKIRISGTNKSSSYTKKYQKVVKGDTLWEIAKNNKSTVNKLKFLNKLKSNRIYPGQKLRVR